MNCFSYKLFLFLTVCFFTVFTARAQDFLTKIDSSRNAYKEAFLIDEHSPLDTADVDQLEFYTADSAFRSIAKVKFIHDDRPIMIPTYSGKEKKYLRYAELNFTIKGKPIKLTLFKSMSLAMDPQYADYLFLPFTDPTNDNDTYGGGRYLDLRKSDIKGDELEVDFNMAYNPYCAYSAGYNCPIPPPENAINVPIQAGEKRFAGTYKKERRTSQ
ncbi:DUF1684 domain-containing protein [Olivibacter domesticus]|uniref:DUF1684 domain-containing protein n=1 Tax=Olivibacter domesticus TaxID=407022 RepID=A0A1H7HTE0_OLID1|nr:DUF1684 domain-containing protein [Olivibacter domesticus]SEK53438.1 hypothetical protein SAMN05661044_00474 [Olivibacter domesticus]